MASHLGAAPAIQSIHGTSVSVLSRVNHGLGQLDVLTPILPSFGEPLDHQFHFSRDCRLHTLDDLFDYQVSLGAEVCGLITHLARRAMFLAQGTRPGLLIIPKTVVTDGKSSEDSST